MAPRFFFILRFAMPAWAIFLGAAYASIDRAMSTATLLFPAPSTPNAFEEAGPGASGFISFTMLGELGIKPFFPQDIPTEALQLSMTRRECRWWPRGGRRRRKRTCSGQRDRRRVEWSCPRAVPGGSHTIVVVAVGRLCRKARSESRCRYDCSLEEGMVAQDGQLRPQIAGPAQMGMLGKSRWEEAIQRTVEACMGV